MATSASSKFPRTSTAKASSTKSTMSDAQRTIDMEELANNTSGARLLCSWVTTFIVSFGVGYVGSLLVNIVTTAMLAFTGSMFLSVLVWVVGLLLTMYLGYRAGIAAGVYVLAGGPEAHYAAAKSAVTSVASSIGSFFTRSASLAA